MHLARNSAPLLGNGVGDLPLAVPLHLVGAGVGYLGRGPTGMDDSSEDEDAPGDQRSESRVTQCDDRWVPEGVDGSRQQANGRNDVRGPAVRCRGVHRGE